MAMEASNSGDEAPQRADTNVHVETEMNLMFLDPPKWGWSALGGVVDVLPPHERARRSSTWDAHVKKKRRNERIAARKKKEAASAKVSSEGMAQGTLTTTADCIGVFPRGDGKPAAAVVDRPTPLAMPKESGPETSVDMQQHFLNGMPTTVEGIAADLAAAIMKNENTTVAGESTIENSISSCAPTGGMSTGENATTTCESASQTTARSVADARNVALPGHSVASEVSSASPSEVIQKESNSVKLGEEREGPAIAAAPLGANDGDPAAAAPLDAAEMRQTNNDHGEETTGDRVIHVQALNEAGILDMYTYHRGREGMEPRDEETGELLCDVEPTDTNYGWEPPNLVVSINVSFPISESGLLFTETVDWDLADARTMTPLLFATRVSEEFGLDAGQTLELAESIQKQINSFVQHKVSYKSPLTLLDAYGNDRSVASAQSPIMRYPPQLFGSAIGDVKAGMPLFQKGTSRASEEAAFLGRRRRLTSKRSLDEEVEPEYRNEVLRRARLASAEQFAEQGTNCLAEVNDSVCHACASRTSVAWKMPCGNQYHMLCKGHLTALTGMDTDDTEESDILEYCPICSLRCDCRKCSRKLSNISAEMKQRCLDQGVPPGNVVFDELFKRCLTVNKRDPERRRAASKKIGKGQSKQRAKALPKLTVPKVPAADFPREVCDGRDIDPGTNDDYRKVYTAEGAFFRNDAPVSDDAKLPRATTEEYQEDGNVDYCHVCGKHGNLLCCDFCPRAFHPECIASEKLSGDGEWECFVCHEEKEAGDSDLVEAEPSVAHVSSSFADIEHSEVGDACAQVLALIHEMVLKLMDYDFGYLFRQPVDCSVVPGYDAVVKNPMDLGTVASRLCDGGYTAKFRENESWDDVIVSALRDIELVWHNCFTFNCEGSSIYRMAEVQNRKYLRIRKRSIDPRLSVEVKRRVDDYVSECRLERSKMVRPDRRANGRNKITVDGTKMKKSNKVVAVLDPETGMLVKMYSTFKAASLAALFLVGLGHAIEFPSLGDGPFKTIVRDSCKDPTLLLFGYRWIYMKDLADGKVKFDASKALPSCSVEVIENESHFFLSVQDALSWPDLPDVLSKLDLQRRLCEMPYGEWTSIGGISWRKTEQSGNLNDAAESQLSVEENATTVEKKCRICDVSKYPFPTNVVVVVKEDLITQRALIGFKSASAAHADWLRTRDGSPAFPVDEPTDFGYFSSFYLDGERNVDGIIWRTLQVSPHIPDEFSTAAHQDIGIPFDNESDRDKASVSQSSEVLEMEKKNVSSSTVPKDGIAPTKRVAANVTESLPLDQEPARAGTKTSSWNLYVKPNGHHPTNGGKLLRTKRSRENDNMASHVPSKKTAVCFN